MVGMATQVAVPETTTTQLQIDRGHKGRLSTGGRPCQGFGQGDESDNSHFSRLEPG